MTDSRIQTQEATLLVGPKKAKIKALFQYYSGSFSEMQYGNFAESIQKDIEAPKDWEDDIRAFVGWEYTDDIYSVHLCDKNQDELFDVSNTTVEPLWIFADKILAPEYMNVLMQHIFLKYDDGYHLQPGTAACEQSTSGIQVEELCGAVPRPAE